MAIVGLDLLLVTLAGVGGAIAAGVAMSSFVLPRLVGTSAGSTPELLAEIDWATTLAIPALLFVAFVVVTGSLLATLRRMRLFEAVKIGADS